MALIRCPECGKEISNQAENCPNCGYPIRECEKHIEKLTAVLSAVKAKKENDDKELESVQETLQAELVQEKQQTEWGACQNKYESQKESSKKRSKNISFGIIYCIVAIIIGFFIQGKREYDGDTASLIGGIIAMSGLIPIVIVAIISFPKSVQQHKKVAQIQRETAICHAQEPVKCPYCGSTQIQAMKKGFSGGKAVAGGLVAGSIGLAAGAIGSGDIERVCLNCKNKF